MKTHDYTKTYWGHSFNCFSNAPKYGSFIHKYLDKRNNVRRYSALVHNNDGVKVGDKILYRAERGVIEGEIYQIKYCGDPRDMYELFFKVTK